MTDIVRMHRTGGPEVLTHDTVTLPPPGAGEARVRQTWAGVNFVDIYHRTGLYPLPALPAAPGVEAAGVVEATGDGVTGLTVGQRVAWAGAPPGGYAQARNIAADRLLPLPDDIPDETVAASLLRGLTVHMLLHRVWPVAAGDVILVQAAAGGLGQLLTSWGKRLGARVIGVVGGEAKAQVALAAGADAVIDRFAEDFVPAVRRLTDGRGVDVAFDGVGGTTLTRSLDCVRPFGLVASLGQAAGALPDMPLTELGPRRSLALARPSVLAYAADPVSYRAGVADLFSVIRQGLAVNVGEVYPLREAAAAHRALESGKTAGSILLDLS